MSTELARRVGTAVIVLPVLIAVVVLAPPPASVALVIGALGLAWWELTALLAAGGLGPARWLGALVAATAFTDVTLAPTPPLTPGAVLLLLAIAAARRQPPATIVASSGPTLAAALYLGLLGGTLASLRTFEPVADGSARLLLLLGIVMGGDTMAYFSGRALGRHRLAPAISPGKTVEGAVGGLLGGAAAGVIAHWVAFPSRPAWILGLLGGAVAIAGTLGDLFESALKRWAGVKDSGALLPGHGGMLDRLDSLLFGAPLLYYYFLCSP